VLDGGQNEVFLGGTRLKRFMESVEKVTTTMEQAALISPPSLEVPEGPSLEKEPMKAEKTQQEILSQLATAGAAFLGELGEALKRSSIQPSSEGGEGEDGKRTSLIEIDSHSGKPYIKLPLPKEDTLRKLGELMSSWLG